MTYNEKLRELVSTDRLGKIEYTDTNSTLQTITKANDLIEFKIEDNIYIDGNFIGSVCSKKLSLKLINDNNKYNSGVHNLENKEIEVFSGLVITTYIEEEVEGETVYTPVYTDTYNSWGNFVITKITNSETDNTCEIEAFCPIVKLNRLYVPLITYEVLTTIRNVYDDICLQCGITKDTTAFLNDDFIIATNQYENRTCREVISDICKMAMGFAKIESGKLCICSLGTSVVDTIDTDVEFTFKMSNTTSPINRLNIGDSVITDEETITQDEASIATYGINELTLNDIGFLYIPSTREDVIDNMFAVINGFSYTPFESEYAGFDTLSSGDKITIKNLAGNSYTSYVFEHSFTFNGGFNGTLKAQALTKAEKSNILIPTAKDVLKRTEIRVDRAEQNIDLLVETTDSLDTRTTELELTTDEINLSVKRSGGINLKENSSAQNGTKFWGYSLDAPYTTSDTPPTSPVDQQYWYCTLTSGSYTSGIVYYYDEATTTWIESHYTKQQLDESNTFIVGVTALNSNNYDNDELRENFKAGSAFKIDSLSPETFNFSSLVSQPIDITDTIYNIDFKIKNNLIDGLILIGCDQTNDYIQNQADLSSNIIDSKFKWIYPEDNFGQYFTYNLQVPIVNSSNLLFGTISDTEPSTPNENDLWLDTSTYQGEVLYKYITDSFVPYTNLSTTSYTNLCDNLTKVIWQCIYFFESYSWLETTIDYTKFIVKQIAPYINLIPTLNIILSATEPTEPIFGCYWLDSTNEKVYRSKYIYNETTLEYDFDSFIERTDLSYTDIIANGFIFNSGSIIVGDIMVYSGTQAKDWTPANNELYGKLVKIDSKGLTVSTYENDNSMNITEAEIVARKGTEKVFEISGYQTILKQTEIQDSLLLGKILTVISSDGTDEYFID